MRLVLLALLVTATPALAQDAPVVVTPGGSALDMSWLMPIEATYVVRIIEPMQMDAGTVTEQTTIADGVVTRVTTLAIPMQNLSMTDSLRADAATLAPLTHHSTGGPSVLSLEFSPEGVVGMAGGEAVVVPLDAPAFDAAWIGEIAQSLPFAEGYVATVSAYDGRSGVVTYTITVRGQEEASGAAGPEPAWIVEAASDAGTATYAISQASRQTLRTRFSPQPGVTLEIVRR